ncbi:hypothetical protein QM281_17870, partial [Acinetobacter baumannii]|uniref:hypothetical protein n=1 Tax=Acinetobacter baumannii TaxID=470 RepID=UPI0024B6E5F1
HGGDVQGQLRRLAARFGVVVVIARGRFHRKSVASGRNRGKATGNPIRTDRARAGAGRPRHARSRALQPERRGQFVEQFALERDEPLARLLRD